MKRFHKRVTSNQKSSNSFDKSHDESFNNQGRKPKKVHNQRSYKIRRKNVQKILVLRQNSQIKKARKSSKKHEKTFKSLKNLEFARKSLKSSKKLGKLENG